MRYDGEVRRERGRRTSVTVDVRLQRVVEESDSLRGWHTGARLHT